MSALDNAIEILRCFTRHQPEISNADVIRLTGKPKSSTSRLLRQLRDCGLLDQDALSRRYRPGLLLFELGRLHRTQNDFVAATEQRLRAICARTGHTGYISVLDGAEQVVLRVVPGSNPLQVVTPPGVGRLCAQWPSSSVGFSMIRYGARLRIARQDARPRHDEHGPHEHHAYRLADRTERPSVCSFLLPADGTDGDDQPAHRQSGRT